MNTQGQSPNDLDRLAREAELRALASGTGQKIGRFVIQEVLGEGAFGAVYRATDPDLGREVAIKVPRGLTAATRKEFLREARAAATIEHPNVCPVYEVSPDGTTIPFIVSRFVRGGTLSALIEQNPNGLAPENALNIALKIAKGVAAAHTRGIVHRDLKPGNVLYDEVNDDFLITDFGMAKLLVHASQSSGGAKGTPTYMSPEQFGDGKKSGDVGPSSDVYALGTILYELLTGKPPFYDMPPFPLMFAHIQTTPDLPSARRADLGTKYDELCLKALKKAPAERHASAKAFADDVAVALRPAPVIVPPPPPPRVPTPEQLRERNAFRLAPALPPPAPTPAQLRAQAEADYKRGDDFYFGRGVARDYAKAREWYEKAAAQNHAPAQAGLGFLYRQGLGVARDDAKARVWYEKAAAQNHAPAQFNLGVLYENGYGVARDYAKAREWYEKAAVQNHAPAQFNLGVFHENGFGVARDDAKARVWYEKAAAQNHATAQCNLGILYESGRGVAKDCAKAREWYEKAASQNHATAQANLADLFERGEGGPLDRDRALELFRASAAQGNDFAKNALKRLG